MPYEELASFSQKLLENELLKKENNSLLNKNDSSKLSIISKENEFFEKPSYFGGKGNCFK